MLLLLLIIVFTEASIYNVSDLSRCKVYYSRSEGKYEDFFKIKQKLSGNDTLLDFHFSVLAPSDAHILFSSSVQVKPNDPVYEIVLGAGGNTFCDIRRAQKAEVQASINMEKLLNALDIQSFWIHISKDGLIEVGKEGEELAFISWKDPHPLSVTFFSFCTWPGIEAKWYYDCPDHQINSQKLERKLTFLDKLRRDLLSNYNPYVPPVFDPSNADIIITLNLRLHYVLLNEQKSTLEIKGVTHMTWEDAKMRWNPDDYGGLSSLQISHREIWQPYLAFSNGVSSSRTNVLGDRMLVVISNGMVEWRPTIHGEVWCNIHEIDHWPSDSHSCSIIITFPNDYQHLILEFNENSDILGKHFGTEWEIIKTKAESSHDSDQAPYLKLTFQLQRISTLYSSIFFTPFLIIAVTFLLEFWISTFGYTRISLGCVQLIISTLILTYLGIIIPVHPTKVPYLISLYSYCLIASVIGMLISIITINLTRNDLAYRMPYIVQKILVYEPIRVVFMLPKINKVHDEYGILDVDQTTDNRNFWPIFALVIDKIAFVIYLFCIIYAISLKY